MKILFITVLLNSSFVFAKNHSISCSFQILNKSDNSIEKLGVTNKQIDPQIDFSIELPGSDKVKWSKVFGENIAILGSINTPKKNWIGLAFSSTVALNTDWSCLKLKSGQEITLLKLSGESVLQADCIVK